MERHESVVEYLRTLDGKGLAEVFYAAVHGRRTSDFSEEKGHFVLADVSLHDDSWSVELIALEDPAEYPQGWVAGSPICQSGQCEDCKSQVRSWAKHMVCPVCGSNVYGS